MIRIEEIKLPIHASRMQLKEEIRKILQLDPDAFDYYKLIKKAVDARKMNNIKFVYTVDVIISNITLEKKIIKRINEAKYNKVKKRHRIRVVEPYSYEIARIQSEKAFHRPVIIGSGPAGLFAGLLLSKAGLQPLIIEKGKEVDERVKDVEHFIKTGELNTCSNIHFGEGGAGTFSDAKLYTLINDHRTKYIFDELIAAGAPTEIAYSARPHIGTDNLRKVVKNLREKIEQQGGELLFEHELEDVFIKNDSIHQIKIKNEIHNVSHLVLAVGNAARDTFEMLYNHDMQMEAKPFSMGVRIEHPREYINKLQYGDFNKDKKLPQAHYKLAVHLKNGRGVYTFCMCPGGSVVPAATEASGVVTNGMSTFAQDNINSNSALLVSVTPDDYPTEHPLSGIQFQRRFEQRAFTYDGGDYFAPTQLLGDFLEGNSTSLYKSVIPSYKPGTHSGDLRECLPDFVYESLKEAIPLLDKKMPGFAYPSAVLTAIETRSSSPVRIIRGDDLQSNIKGIFPAGEGAGYAGGIVSSAVDGMKVAEKIIDLYRGAL
ncbi:MAG: NAD(P)/FAD-dependent oxidoreductase [Candidatus Cloacimonetes bacterium]|nr:NAD(P)/FAD-dependent oxidoreductase [Candidatus Cloacimonadota bacterium]